MFDVQTFVRSVYASVYLVVLCLRGMTRMLTWRHMDHMSACAKRVPGVCCQFLGFFEAYIRTHVVQCKIELRKVDHCEAAQQHITTNPSGKCVADRYCSINL